MAPRLAVQRGAYSESLRAGRPQARPNDEPPAKQSRSAYDMSLRVPHAAWAACAPARTSRRHCECRTTPGRGLYLVQQPGRQVA